MTIEQVISYVLHTPHNTNKTILRQILMQMIKTYGSNPELPEDPNLPAENIIYDGGVEA